MKCKAVRKVLPAYMDSELEPAAREVVKTHLNLCPACSLALQGLKRTLAAARAWDARPLPAGFADAVRERAAAGGKMRRVSARPAPAWPLPIGVPRFVWQAAAPCLILMVGLSLGYWVWPDRNGQGTTDGQAALAREEAIEMIESLQKLKTVLILRGGRQDMIIEHSKLQAQLAKGVGPEVAEQVAAYHRAEWLIGQGHVDEAEAAFNDLEASGRSGVLARYVPITLLAARTLPTPEPRGYAGALLPELLAAPERLHEAMAKHCRNLARDYVRAVDDGIEALNPANLPRLVPKRSKQPN